jgi:aryl-alcohol dehydrogenase-like predicted oxidoreductase
MRWLDDAVIKTGKALHIALSDAPAWQGAVANTLARTFGWSPFVAYQGKYSLLDRSFDQEVLPMARKMSMGVIPWGVTGENKLVGTSSHAPDEREKKIADKVAEIAKELNCMPVQVCYAWVINRPGIACALVGPGTLVALENMMKSMDVTLSEEHMKELTEVSDTPLLFPYSLIGTDTDSCQSLYGTKRTFSIDKRQ